MMMVFNRKIRGRWTKEEEFGKRMSEEEERYRWKKREASWTKSKSEIVWVMNAEKRKMIRERCVLEREN